MNQVQTLDQAIQSETRFEKKFATTKDNLTTFLTTLKLSPLRIYEIYPFRQVNNLYFDDHELSLYQASLDGLPNRFKVRIRWYGHLQSPSPHYSLEVKIKNRDVVTKLVLPLPFTLNFFDSSPRKTKNILVNSVNEPFKDLLKGLSPTLISTYRRRYFTTASRQLRLTLDDCLVFSRQISHSRFHLPFNHPNSLGIIELKYSPSVSEEAGQIMQLLPLSLTRYSKYVSGLIWERL